MFSLLGMAAVYTFGAMTLAFVLALLPCFLFPGKGALSRKTAVSQKGGWPGKAWLVWAGLGILFLLQGYRQGGQALAQSQEELAMGLEGTRQSLWGRVHTAKRSGKYLVLILKDCVLPEENSPEEKRGLQRLQVYLEPEEGDVWPVPGSTLTVRGEISLFPEARNPGEWDYALYYRSQGLTYRMFADSWQETGKPAFSPGGCLHGLAEHGGQILEKIADPQDAAIFQAAILGERSQLGEEIRSLYQKNGISHLLAISGLHLSLVSAAVYGVLRRLGAGYRTAGIFGGILLTAYAVMTGASPSVMRALVMALCGFLAAALGRTYDLPSALALGAILLLWGSPYRLFQAGVQLSFGAVAGIAVVSEEILSEDQGKKRERKGAGRRLGETLVYSLGIQLTTLPLVLYHFFQVPLYGIFLNLLVVPLMGIVVASGTAGILLGSIWLPAGRFAAGSGHVVLRLYEYLCRLWQRLPGSLLILGRPGPGQMAVYFGVLAAFFWLWRRGKRRYPLFLLAVLPCLLLQMPFRGMEAVFLDVGQGDGICIRTQNTVILVDGGSTDQKQLGPNRLVPYLKSRGISSVDYGIVSHGDQDHISGLVYLMEEGEISLRTLILPWQGRGEEVYRHLEQMTLAQGGRAVWMKRGESLELGRLRILCRYPDEAANPSEDRNEHSLVMQVDYGKFHMLLTGDMSGGGERHLLELEQNRQAEGKYPGLEEVQVLKVAHHGSRYSTTEEWLDFLQPRWAVISYGRKNRYGHPDPEVLQRLEEKGVKIWETAKGGAISLRTDGERIWWDTWIADP